MKSWSGREVRVALGRFPEEAELQTVSRRLETELPNRGFRDVLSTRAVKPDAKNLPQNDIVN